MRIFTILIPHPDGATEYTTVSKDGMTARKVAAKSVSCPIRITSIIKVIEIK